MDVPDKQGGRLRAFGQRALVALLVTVAVGLGFEVLLRFVLTYNIEYYTLNTNPGTHELPYGEVRINSLGYPDEEWDLADPRPRVGYLGDSVVFGTGAGYGYRFSDVLGEARPAEQHLTLSSAQLGIHNPKNVLKFVDEFSLSTVVYAMNLNDVLPTRPKRVAGGGSGSGGGRRRAIQTVYGLVHRLDGLRGVSYLYNYTRTRLRNVMRRRGYVETGGKDVEFYPKESERLIRETAERVNRAAAVLKEHGVDLCVLLIPYEMQISEEAALRYWELGIRWEDDFIDRGTQRKLLEYLEPDLEVVDAYYAFVRPDSADQDRARNGLGEYFVYNRGDKIDYIHPTRLGHRKIAEYALSQGFCAPRELANWQATSDSAVRP